METTTKLSVKKEPVSTNKQEATKGRIKVKASSGTLPKRRIDPRLLIL